MLSELVESFPIVETGRGGCNAAANVADVDCINMGYEGYLKQVLNV